MRGQTIGAAAEFTVEDCAACHVHFAMPSDMVNRLRETGKSFYCPRGHSMSFEVGPSEAEKLRKRLAAVNQRAEEHFQETERLARVNRSLRGVVTRIKNKNRNGGSK